MKKTLAKNIGKIMALISCLIIALTLVSCSDSGKTSENGEGLYFTLNEDGESYTVSGVLGDGMFDPYTRIIIPEEYDGKTVTRIECLGEENLLYEGIFNDGNSSLEYLEIPQTIEYINYEFINECSALQSIEVDENNPYYKSVYGNLYDKSVTVLICYAKNSLEESFELPSSVTEIYHDAFWLYNSLEEITVAEGNTQYKSLDGVLYRINEDGETLTLVKYPLCKNDTSYTIPSNVTTIGKRAFIDCTNLESITVPESVVNIDSWAFYGCASINNVYITDIAKWCEISFGDQGSYGYSNPLYYAENLYCNNKLITDLVIPDGVTSIGDSVFSHYTLLESVTIPDSVTSIGDDAFSGCTSLTSVTIPDSVTDIGWHVFDHSSNLTIYCECDAKPEGWKDSWVYSYNSDNGYANIIWGYIPE